MSIPTPLYNLKPFPNVYEPSEDTFLFLNTIESDLDFIKSLKPLRVVEIGCGSGIVITFLARALENKFIYFATDINPSACLAALETARLNCISLECVNMNLLDNFSNLQFDVILFNPPYVVTDDDDVVGKGLNRAWAGGRDGRRIIDEFLLQLGNLLSDTGACYMVVIKENKPEEIKKSMFKLGFDTKVIEDRKILGEHLFVLRFTKIVCT